MANLSKKERDYFYPQLVQRDGEKCASCNKQIPEVNILEVHEDVYERPLKLQNMRLICHGCNHKKEFRMKNMIRTSSVSAEHKKAIAAYPLFMKWLEGEINKPENNYHIPYDSAIDQAAFDVGMLITGVPLSPETTKRYLGPLCDHPTSPYVTRADNFGQMNIWLRGKEPTSD